MLELLFRLECRRRAFRRRVLAHFGGQDSSLYAIAGVISLALCAGLISPTTAAATAPPVSCQYVEHLDGEARPDDGAPDIGAFERP